MDVTYGRLAARSPPSAPSSFSPVQSFRQHSSIPPERAKEGEEFIWTNFRTAEIATARRWRRLRTRWWIGCVRLMLVITQPFPKISGQWRSGATLVLLDRIWRGREERRWHSHLSRFPLSFVVFHTRGGRLYEPSKSRSFTVWDSRKHCQGTPYLMSRGQR